MDGEAPAFPERGRRSGAERKAFMTRVSPDASRNPKPWKAWLLGSALGLGWAMAASCWALLSGMGLSESYPRVSDAEAYLICYGLPALAFAAGLALDRFWRVPAWPYGVGWCTGVALWVAWLAETGVVNLR